MLKNVSQMNSRNLKNSAVLFGYLLGESNK